VKHYLRMPEVREAEGQVEKSGGSRRDEIGETAWRASKNTGDGRIH
jgi:hypothetical protein